MPIVYRILQICQLLFEIGGRHVKQSKPVLNDEMLEVPDIVRELKIKSGWIYQRIHAGTLPFPYVKIGQHLRFLARGLREFVAAQTRQANTGSAA